MEKEYNSEQKMRTDAIGKGLAGGYATDYSSLAIALGVLLAFILLVSMISRRKKPKS